MAIVCCLDLEGVLEPEIWVNVAEQTGIDELRVTTRDISDYDELMTYRLAVMDREGLDLATIQRVIEGLNPLEGAEDFLEWLRSWTQVIIVSDTFAEFARPLMRRLGWPTIFCHSLEVTNGRITGYRLRQSDAKRHSVKALQSLNYRVIASGDSYNDTGMLTQADAGVWMCPPDSIVREYPQFPVARDFEQLRARLSEAAERLESD